MLYNYIGSVYRWDWQKCTEQYPDVSYGFTWQDLPFGNGSFLWIVQKVWWINSPINKGIIKGWCMKLIGTHWRINVYTKVMFSGQALLNIFWISSRQLYPAYNHLGSIKFILHADLRTRPFVCGARKLFNDIKINLIQSFPLLYLSFLILLQIFSLCSCIFFFYGLPHTTHTQQKPWIFIYVSFHILVWLVLVADLK